MLEKLEELFKEYQGVVDKLDKNDRNYGTRKSNISMKYARDIIKLLENDSMAMKIAVLDMLFNDYPQLLYCLLCQKNKDFMRSYAVLECFRGTFSEIVRFSYHPNNARLENPSEEMKKYYPKIWELMGGYLYGNNITRQEDLYDVFHDFAVNFQSIYPIMFDPRKNYLIDRKKTIGFLFNFPSEFVKIYELISSYLDEDDYSFIIISNTQGFTVFDGSFLTMIPGFYRHLSNDAFDMMFDDRFSFEDYESRIDSIIRANIDDYSGIKWFLRESEKRIIKNPEKYKLFIESEYFKKYLKMNIYDSIDDCINKILSGNNDFDDTVLDVLWKEPKFLENYDKIFDIFMKTNNLELKKKLFYPLILGLAKKELDKRSLSDVKIQLMSKERSKITYGEYINKDKTLMINSSFLEMFSDINIAFVQAVDTIFHEIRHANQYEFNDLKKTGFNYDNLVTAIDFFLEDINRNIYYQNYNHITFERDAVNHAYKQTMRFFSDYPMMQDLEESVMRGTGQGSRKTIHEQSDYVRQGDDNSYYGIIDLFIKEVKKLFEIAKTDEGTRDIFFNTLSKYPIFNTFFKIDLVNYTIDIYDPSHYKKYAMDAILTNNDLEIKQFRYSFHAFVYALKVGKQLHQKKFENDREVSTYLEDTTGLPHNRIKI